MKTRRKKPEEDLARLAAENAHLREENLRLQQERDALASAKRQADELAAAVEKLEQDNQAMELERQKLLEQSRKLLAENEGLRLKVDDLSRQLFGKSSERVSGEDLAQAARPEEEPEPSGSPPFVGEAPDVETPASPERRRKRRKKKPSGRKPLPKDLPRETVVIEVPAEDLPCPCCGLERRPFAEEVTEVLEYVPASFRLIRYVRRKCSCDPCQGQVVCPDLPPMPIEKGRPGPGLLAHVLTAKYSDHLPLHRLSGIYAREGVDIGRSTLCDWVAASGALLKPIVTSMQRRILRHPVVGVDETGIQVRDDEAEGGIRNGRMWAWRGAPGDVVFEHTATKAGDNPRSFLGGFQGYLQADAANNYDRLFEDGRIFEVGCWAHTRRKFFKIRELFPEPCDWVLAAIRSLYKIESEAKGLAVEDVFGLRQARSRPLVEKLFAYLAKLKETAVAGSALAKAIGYATRQEAALRRFLENGLLQIDNNAVERALRQVAVGRKNWLFAGSAQGAETGAIAYSLVVSCRELKIDPFEYLRDVIERVSTHPASRVEELTPRDWARIRVAPAP